MQIVIDIDDKVYGLLKYYEESLGLDDKKDGNDDVKTALMRAVLHGISLPKGHGRLIDVDALFPTLPAEELISRMSVQYAPVILEADTEGVGSKPVTRFNESDIKRNKYYIRFGNIPVDEQSRYHKGDEIVKQEKGVSVWNSTIANDVYYPVLPNNPNEFAVQDYFSFIWGNKEVYLVTGNELSETGTCGEPLIINVKIVRELTSDYDYQKTIAQIMKRRNSE